METPLSQSPNAAAHAQWLEFEAKARQVVLAETSASQTNTATPGAAPSFPTLSPGHQSSEFYLSLIIVTAIFAALWQGKIDPALASALLGLIVSGYPSLRTWLKAQHIDALALVLATQTGNRSFRAVAGAVAGMEGKMASEEQAATASRISAAVLAPLVMLGAMLSVAGCAQTPYYVSGINGTVDTSKDGTRIAGGGMAVTISPNPNYHLPAAASLRK